MNHDHDDHHQGTIDRNARYGIILFTIYVLMYAGFIGMCVFLPDLMKQTPTGGVNLAIIYGFGLIVAALVLALVYMVLCRKRSA